MSLNYSVKSYVEKKLTEYEGGRLNHMYLDTKKRVTIGIGHLIKNRSAVSSIKMYTIKNNQPSTEATTKQKQDEYDTILKKGNNDYKASWYKQYTSLMMKESDIDAQFKKHIELFYSELARVYSKSNGYAKNFDAFPVDAQKALFDMIFNLGQPNLRDFVKFNAAIKKEQWDEAAKESNRKDVKFNRNQHVKDLLNAAHKASQK